jgi:toxin ParE1/3/4
MIDFQLTEKAIEDLRSIGRYTQKNWGRDQRNKYLAKLDDSFHTIAREIK